MKRAPVPLSIGCVCDHGELAGRATALPPDHTAAARVEGEAAGFGFV